MPPTSLPLRVARFAAEEKIFRGVNRVLCAVSGGPDSLAMLLVLLELREQFGIEVAVAHFDHQLRPDSADDLKFVRAFAEERGLTCYTGEGDVRAAARDRRGSIEDTARRMRYQFLSFVAAEKAAEAVVTGHTADDQAETVLLHIARGSGVRGLQGMVPSGGIPGATAQRLARPLLCATREETRAYCEAAGVEPLIDPSNDEPAFTRNRVRSELLPALETINPAARTALLGLAESAREAFAGIERQSFGARAAGRSPLGSLYETGTLRSLPSEAQTLVIEREAAFLHLEPEVNRTRLHNLRAVLARGAGSVRFGPVAVEASLGRVRIGPVLEAPEVPRKVLNVPGTTLLGPWRVDVTTSAPGRSDTLAVDPGAAQGALRARALEPGDRIVFRGIDRKVSDAFAAARVPAWERPLSLAVADGRRVLAIFTPTALLPGTAATEDALFVRATAVPQTSR